MTEDLIFILLQWIESFGYIGSFTVMFLIGSCLPIPWEPVLILTGASTLDPMVSASLGAVLNFYLAKALGRPLFLRYGRYILVERAGLERAERWFLTWGPLATFIDRSIPFMPYKTFSLSAGILDTAFPPYILFTTAGSIFRCFLVTSVEILSRLRTRYL
ncbi:MAG: DedA family protein [Candidatus Bathyarchaeia archaeon]